LSNKQVRVFFGESNKLEYTKESFDKIFVKSKFALKIVRNK